MLFVNFLIDRDYQKNPQYLLSKSKIIIGRCAVIRLLHLHGNAWQSIGADFRNRKRGLCFFVKIRERPTEDFPVAFYSRMVYYRKYIVKIEAKFY